MALEIFRLVGSVFVDSDAAEKSLSKTDNKAQGVGSTLAKGIKTAGQWGAAIVGGAAAAVTGIAAFAAKTASTTDEIDKMSQKIGISRQSYQELDYILSQNGMEVNQLQTGLKTLNSQMYAAANGSKASAAYFTELGVATTDASGKLRSQEDVFYDTIAALQNMDNETERNALAVKMFGKSATELSPLLNSGAGSMEELRQKAHDLGMVLDDDVIDSGVQLTDTIDTLKRTGGSIITKLGGAVMPLVQKVANYIIKAMPKIEALFQKLSPIIEQLFTNLVPPLMELASQLFPSIVSILTAVMPILTQIIETVLPIIVNLLQQVLPVVVAIVEQLLPPLLELLLPLLELLGPLLDLLTPILDALMSILGPITDLITKLLTPLMQIIVKIIEVALKPIKGVIELIVGLIARDVKARLEWLINIFTTIKGVFSGFIDFIKGVFTGDWQKAWDGVKQIFSNIWEGIKNAFKIPINWIIDGINVFIKGLNKLKIPDWVPGVGGKGLNIKEIPRLYQGAVLEKGETGFLEGNGAEAVVPLHENKKWIRALKNDMEAEGIGGGDKTLDILTAILALLEDLTGWGIYVDKDKLVGELAPGMDKKLGQIAAKKARA